MPERADDPMKQEEDASSLRDELLALIARDDETRERLAKDGSLFEGYNVEMEAVHRANAARLRELIARWGWPDRTLVGEDGASAAWRIVQHAIGEPDFVRSCLPRIEAAVAAGRANPAELAMLVDRVHNLEGRPQIYGTQVDWNDDGTAMVPMGAVEDPETVDQRRAAVGLPPIAWRTPPPPDEAPPRDLAARRAEMDAWARRVGWRSGSSGRGREQNS